MAYLNYNQPLIYINSKKYKCDYIPCRFMFAKPDNGNYIIKTDIIVSMYLEVKPNEVVDFDKAVRLLREEIEELNDKLNWHKNNLLPARHIVDNIISLEKEEKVIQKRMNETQDDNKKENYKKQIQNIHHGLRRLRKRTFNFDYRTNYDIHNLSNSDFSEYSLKEKIEDYNKTIKEIEDYRKKTENEKPFML